MVIDMRRCIGCGACVASCKAENYVHLGGFRTWVEKHEGEDFPTSRSSSLQSCATSAMILPVSQSAPLRPPSSGETAWC